jgi:hypothetical protein
MVYQAKTKYLMPNAMDSRGRDHEEYQRMVEVLAPLNNIFGYFVASSCRRVLHCKEQ